MGAITTRAGGEGNYQNPLLLIQVDIKLKQCVITEQF